MNKLIILLIVLFLSFDALAQDDFKRPASSDYPVLPQHGKTVGDFVPRNWETVSKVSGDLNGDNSADYVLVVKANDSKFLNKNDGLGSDTFDTNPRVLIILFKDENGYKLAKQSNTFIVAPESPVMEEPFQGAAIKNAILQLDFEIFYSAGSWSMSQYSYKFKFLSGEFALIGADRIESMRNTGEMQTQSYNFLTNKLKVTTGNFTEDKPEKVRWKKLKQGKLKTFDTFKEPFS